MNLHKSVGRARFARAVGCQLMAALADVALVVVDGAGVAVGRTDGHVIVRVIIFKICITVITEISAATSRSSKWLPSGGGKEHDSQNGSKRHAHYENTCYG